MLEPLGFVWLVQVCRWHYVLWFLLCCGALFAKASLHMKVNCSTGFNSLVEGALQIRLWTWAVWLTVLIELVRGQGHHCLWGHLLNYVCVDRFSLGVTHSNWKELFPSCTIFVLNLVGRLKVSFSKSLISTADHRISNTTTVCTILYYTLL